MTVATPQQPAPPAPLGVSSHKGAITLILVLIFGGVLGLLGLDLKTSLDREYEISRRDSNNLLKLVEGQIITIFTKSDLVLQEVVRAYTPAMTGQAHPDLRKTNQELLLLMNSIPETQKHSLRLINSEGRVAFNAGLTADLPDVSVGDRTYFLTQKEDPTAGLVVSEPIKSRFTGQWLITLSRRFNHADGRFAGLAQVAIRADALQGIFERLTLDSKTAITLFDTKIRMVSRNPLIPEQLGKQFPATELQQAVATGQLVGNYQTKSRVDGILREHTFRKVENLPMLVVLGVAPEEFLAGWRLKAWLYGVSALVMSLLLLALLRALKKAETDKALQIQERFARLSAEETSRSKSQLLDVISHELRTPMNGIQGATQLLEMTPLNGEQAEYLSIAKDCSESLMSMISDILDYTQLQGGQMEAAHEAFTPGTTLDEAAAAFAQRARAKGLGFTWRIDASLNTPAKGDPVHLKRLVGILIDNAIKFTDQGQIHIAAEYAPLAAPHFQLRWSITDSGIGIAPEKQGLLFSPFTQGDSSTTRRHGGSGLGLAIAKNLVQLMGGEIGTESTLGQGSRFWFTIPLEITTADD